MILIICLDDKNGISFADRRQSRDKLQIERMLEKVGNAKLYISEYSAPLFGALPQNVVISSSPLDDAVDGDYCFVEREEVMETDFEEIIIYRWHRVYPSDIKFDMNLLNSKEKVSSFEFKGNSHEKITEEIYR